MTFKFLAFVLAAFLAFPSGPLPLIAQGQTPTPCALCQDQHLFVCPPCKGSGSLVVACRDCDKGKVECGLCTPAFEKSQKTLSPLKKRGHLPCPNPSCKGGKVKNSQGKSLRCALCKGKGALKCKHCRGAHLTKCAPCGGKRKRKQACEDCTGTGKLPCVGCVVPPHSHACPLCQDGGLRKCPHCSDKPEESLKSQCKRCEATGVRPCEDCKGHFKRPCDVCRATGRMVLPSEDGLGRGRSGKCDRCNGRGYDKCGHCTKGSVDCEWCEKGVASGDCASCQIESTFLCTHCASGSVRLAQIGIPALIGAKMNSKATQWIDATLKRLPKLKSKTPWKVLLKGSQRAQIEAKRFLDRYYPPSALGGGAKGPGELLDEYREALRTQMEALRERIKN